MSSLKVAGRTVDEVTVALSPPVTNPPVCHIHQLSSASTIRPFQVQFQGTSLALLREKQYLFRVVTVSTITNITVRLKTDSITVFGDTRLCNYAYCFFLETGYVYP